METAKRDTGVSWEVHVAFDFDCEPNSLSPLLSGGKILWTMHDENTNLDNSCTILFGSPFIGKDGYFVWLLGVELSAQAMAAVWPGQPDHQRSSGIIQMKARPWLGPLGFGPIYTT